MSGYKRATVTISEQEYRRLHEADMKRRFRGHSRAKAEESGSAQELANTLRQMEDRQRGLEHALSAMGQQVSHVEVETMQKILMENRLCYERLAVSVGEAASNTSVSITHMYELIAEDMEREREQYRQSLHTLFRQMDMVHQKEYVKEQFARDWLSRSAILADFVQNQFDHERFTPGRLSKSLLSLEIARKNLAEGLDEASLLISQQTYVDLSELHFELEQRVVQWRSEYEHTLGAARQIVADMECSTTVSALGLQGEELPIQVDVNYWTCGRYYLLLEKGRQLQAFLEQDHRTIPMEDLHRVNSQILPLMEDSLGNLIYEARLHALNSQLRMNIAERALQALEHHGFNLSESGYTDNDMRAPFRACLDNPDGSRVTIQVIPGSESSQDLTNELVVITNHPYLKTEHEARLHWEELCQTLNQYRLDVSRPDILHGPPPTFTDTLERSSPVRQQPIHFESKKDVR